MTNATANPCPRCEGTGMYKDKGECFKCKGTGELKPVISNQLYEKKESANMSVKMEMGITNEMQIATFEVIVRIINSKGGENKMCSIFDIHNVFKADGVETSKIMIEAVLDVLIQRKYIRYFRNDRGYIYFGITGLGWARWAQKIIKDTEVASTETQPELTDEQKWIVSNLPPDDELAQAVPPTTAEQKAQLEKEWKEKNAKSGKAK